MYSDKKKNRLVPVLLLVLVIAAAAVLAVLAVNGANSERRTEGAEAIRQTVTDAARQCYAVEGVYPPNLRYLEEHYGIAVNTKDYYVTYDAFASNLPPAVEVIPKPGK
ncbi:MAG: hypothetical protein IJU57_02640 [Clostridia bacterium]|nr:hypothetical protein [Clostridia bacterium]